MKGLHRHCVCNGVWLCGTCHRDVHRNPDSARDEGFIVSRYTEEPAEVPLRAWYGVIRLDCHGFYTHYSTEKADEF